MNMWQWQKNGKGSLYSANYLRDAKGERVVVLVGLRSNGEVHTITAESWQMLAKVGWIRVRVAK